MANKPSENVLQRYSYIVALFLAEVIRSRKTPIARAAEISTRVVNSLDRVKDEAHLLEMLKAVEEDFEEVTILRQALHFGYEKSDIRIFEREIKEFAAEMFKVNMALSARFLQDAAKETATVQQLCLKYPDFCSFVTVASESGGAQAVIQNRAS